MKRMLAIFLALMATSISCFPQTQASGTGSNNADTNVLGAQAHSDTSIGVQGSTTSEQGTADQGKSRNGDRNANNSSKSHRRAHGDAQGTGTAGISQTAIASGTQIPIELTKGIDCKKAKQGDAIMARTTADVVSNGKVVVPRGSRVLGRVTESKARAKGDSESALGLMFDRIELRGGQTVSLTTIIQAVAQPARMEMPADSTESGAEHSSMAGAQTNGGPASVAGGALGGTASAATGIAGGGLNTAGNAAGEISQTPGGLSQSATSVHGAIGNGTTGVLGLKDINLESTGSAEGSTNGSVLTSTGKNIRLESGTQMVLKAAAGAR